MSGIDIYDDSYVEVVSDPGVDKAKLILKNEMENQVNYGGYNFWYGKFKT